MAASVWDPTSARLYQFEGPSAAGGTFYAHFLRCRDVFRPLRETLASSGSLFPGPSHQSHTSIAQGLLLATHPALASIRLLAIPAPPPPLQAHTCSLIHGLLLLLRRSEAPITTGWNLEPSPATWVSWYIRFPGSGCLQGGGDLGGLGVRAPLPGGKSQRELWPNLCVVSFPPSPSLPTLFSSFLSLLNSFIEM